MNRVPTELTREEKKFTLQCERECRTMKARYHDINAKDMIRCPLESCHHTILNARNINNSIGIHFRESHSAPQTAFVITYTTRGKFHRIHYPDTLDAKQAGKEGWISHATEKCESKKEEQLRPTSQTAQAQDIPVWPSRDRFHKKQQKPTTEIERYRQLTITEMMLNMRKLGETKHVGMENSQSGTHGKDKSRPGCVEGKDASTESIREVNLGMKNDTTTEPVHSVRQEKSCEGEQELDRGSGRLRESPPTSTSPAIEITENIPITNKVSKTNADVCETNKTLQTPAAGGEAGAPQEVFEHGVLNLSPFERIIDASEQPKPN